MNTFFSPDIVPVSFVLPTPSRTFISENLLAYDCEVTGLPPPKVEWFKDNERLDPANLTAGFEITYDYRYIFFSGRF